MCNQHCERLFYEGIERGMENEPLDVYFRYAGINPVFNWRSTALYRGYIGTWEIADQQLYLIGLKGNLRKDRLVGGEPVNVGTFFPDHPDRVFAHWYSGTIALPQGEILDDDTRDYRDVVHERDLLIRLKKGIVINTEVRVNKTKAEREAEFAERKAEYIKNLPPGVEYDDEIF